MTTLVRSFFIVILAFVTGCASLSEQTVSMVDRPAGNVRVMWLEGGYDSLSDEMGITQVLMFWATWCRHSRSAIEELEELAKGYKTHPSVRFTAISIDDQSDFATLQDRIESGDLKSMRHAFSGNATQDEAFLKFHGDQVPFFVIIDGRGITRYVGLGVSGVESKLEDLALG